MTDSKMNVMPFYTINLENAKMMDPGIMRVKVSFLHKVTNKQEIEQYFEDIQAVYARNRFFIISYDANEITSETLQNLKQLNNFMTTKDDESRKLVIACAVIISKPALLKLVKTVLFIKKAACPLRICSSNEEAEAFLAQFREAFEASRAFHS